MPRHLNLDTCKALNDDITFEFGNKTYTVVDLTDDVIRDVDAVESMNLDSGRMLSAQLALLTGTEASEFSGLTVLQKRGAIAHVTDYLQNPLRAR